MPTSPCFHPPDRQLHHCSHTGVWLRLKCSEHVNEFLSPFPLLPFPLPVPFFLRLPSFPFFSFPFHPASYPLLFSPPLTHSHTLYPTHTHPSHTQAMSAHVGSVVDGPTSSGKVQLIKGIGLLCGRFVPTFHCSALMEKATIARIFEGLAQVLTVRITAQWWL